MARVPPLIYFSMPIASVVDPDSDPDSMGTRRAKMTHKNKIKINKFYFLVLDVLF
jgi:hypothetical protein